MIKNAFSVDLEDWYQGLEVIPIDTWNQFQDRIWTGTQKLLDLLDKTKTRATVFVLGYLAERHPTVVKEIHKRGHRLATHGYGHNLIYKMSPDEFGQDLERSIKVIEDITGERIVGHRAPFFSITQKSLWAFDILWEKGIRYDSSIFPVINYRYGISSAERLAHCILLNNGNKILEIPLSVVRIMGFNLPIGGGAYMRIFPYKVIQRGFRYLNEKGIPGVFYVHPWELDPLHPIIRLPFRIKVSHYYNLKSTEFKLNRLLEEFKFAPIEDVFQLE